jgi:hypothetical protein
MSQQLPLSVWFVNDKWPKKLSIHGTSCDFIIQTPQGLRIEIYPELEFRW